MSPLERRKNPDSRSLQWMRAVSSPGPSASGAGQGRAIPTNRGTSWVKPTALTAVDAMLFAMGGDFLLAEAMILLSRDVEAIKKNLS